LAWNFTPSPVAALAECPHAANLKKLYLPGGLDDELFHKLQQSPYLKNAVLRGAF
jgi:hypothetical protein